jgi:hypothetical protein
MGLARPDRRQLDHGAPARRADGQACLGPAKAVHVLTAERHVCRTKEPARLEAQDLPSKSRCRPLPPRTESTPRRRPSAASSKTRPSNSAHGYQRRHPPHHRHAGQSLACAEPPGARAWDTPRDPAAAKSPPPNAGRAPCASTGAPTARTGPMNAPVASHSTMSRRQAAATFESGEASSRFLCRRGAGYRSRDTGCGASGCGSSPRRAAPHELLLLHDPA